MKFYLLKNFFLNLNFYLVSIYLYSLIFPKLQIKKKNLNIREFKIYYKCIIIYFKKKEDK